MGEFMRNFQRVQREQKERREEEQRRQQQQEQPQQQPEQQQQPEAAGLKDYHDWAAKNLPDQQQQPTPATTTTTTTTPNKGKATFSIISYLTDKQATYPPGVVKERIASIEEIVASPPHGVDPQTLVGGLPQLDSSFSSSCSTVSVVLRKVKPVNTSTGSVEVDGLELKLGDTDMDVNKEEDAELLELARDNSDMEEGDGTA
jgi:hypothetical protein